jgi:CheY-like chemotaxis protein
MDLSEIQANQLRKLTVLIVEDDETSEMLIRISLSAYCNNILNATTGVEAVEISRNNADIDLILMDINMPVMDGYKATREIRRFNQDVVIIAQTAFSLPIDHKQALEAGCNDYITKPLNIASLKGLILKHFELE